MPNGNQVARFDYNQRLELIRSERNRGCAPPEVHSYAYDLNHNFTKKDDVSYTNNLADQLLNVGSGTLTYNDSGQASNVQGWDLTYNCADQITGIQAPGKNIAYRYDGAGQRVSKSVNGVTQNFLWNGADIAKEYASNGSVRADYFLGAGREGIKTGGQWYYYLSDVQGSTLMLTDSSGHSAATYDYSDYGITRQTSGSTSLYNPFLYTGQEYDFETSLYHLRARHYSPELGRFFSRDPIGYAGGGNMMAYCAGDPINNADPDGLKPSPGAMRAAMNFRHEEPRDPTVEDLGYTLFGAGLLFESWMLVVPSGEYLMARWATRGSSTQQAVTSEAAAAESGAFSAARRGDSVHYDELNGRPGTQSGPSAVQNKYPDTRFRFAKQGEKGVDVKVTGGKMPWEYEGSNWPKGVRTADIKPGNANGYQTFMREMRKGKIPAGSIPLPYNPDTLRVHIP